MVIINFNFISVMASVTLLLLLCWIIIKLKQRVKLLIIRLLLILILILLVSEIIYKIPKKGAKPSLALLVDTSYSMKFNNRLTRIKKFIENNFNKLNTSLNITLYEFNDKVVKVDDIKKLTLSNNGTKIHSAIENLLFQKKDVDAIMLLSDGINNSIDLPIVDGYNTKIVPIVFEEENFKDVTISNLRYSNFGFKDINYEISFEINSYGYKDIMCKITLIQENNNNIVSSKEIILKDATNNVKLSFIPRETGKFKYKIKVQKFNDEITHENNELSFDLQIKKNKIRILYICGQPSPEYYFLRNLIKNDPNIDLVSFVILRNMENVVIVPDEDLALIPFPTYDIFVKEIFNYDLLIFENFSYRRFNIPIEYLENIKRFVTSGGGFIMIGGINAFFLGGYKNTPIEEILPVKMSETEKFVTTEYKPRISNANDKLLKVTDDLATTKLIWQNIPTLNNYQKIMLKPESTPLMFYQDIPVMCYWTKGKGRVFVSGTNTTWRWVLGNILSSRYDYKQVYTQFWKNVIYWCSGVEELKNLYITTDNEKYKLGDDVKIKVYYNKSNALGRKENLLPEVYVTSPDLNKKKLVLNSVSGEQFTTDFTPSLVGKYIITAIMNKEIGVLKDTKEIFVEPYMFQELARVKPDTEYLMKLAKLTESKIISEKDFNIDKFISEVKTSKPKQYAFMIEFYRQPLLGIIFILLFLLDIYFGKFKK